MLGHDGQGLAGRRILVTGVADRSSLALAIASGLQRAGADLVCAGLGPTPHHGALSERAARYLATTWDSSTHAVGRCLGPVPTFPLDVTVDATIGDLAQALATRGLVLDGMVHAIAMDRTIRNGSAKPLLMVTREEFLDCLDVSAYSLIAIVRALLDRDLMADGSAVVALSYLGAERVVPHPYKNVGVAKAALERIARELAAELGPTRGIRVNTVRFSPWAESRAGAAIPGLADAVARCGARAPLGNARPEDLAREVAHLLHPGVRVTGEVRHVDGGYHALA